MSQPATSKLWSIQYLRALAAVWVVLFHRFGHHSSLFEAGSHGVDIFFVISGFIMVAMTDGRDIGPARFLLDRIARIVPVYWLATGLCFLAVRVGWPFYAASSRPDLLVRSLLFIPSVNDNGIVWPTLFLGWTLNYEMFFYALFALALTAHDRLRLPLLGGVLISLVLLGESVRPDGTILQTYTSPLLLEFAAGALLGRIFGIDLRRQTWPRLAWSTLFLLVGAGAVTVITPGMRAAPFAIALVAAGLAAERLGLVPQITSFRTLGDASFAIYLFQQFAFEAVRWMFAALAAATPLVSANGRLSRAAGVCAAIVLGIAVFRFVERPLTRRVRAGLFRLTAVPAWMRPS